MHKNVLEMIPVDGSQKNDRWNDFEHAATHSYARSIIEQEKRKGILTADDIYPKTTMNTTEYSYSLNYLILIENFP
jgi:hypothetical protein